MSLSKYFTNGIWKENPSVVLVLGTCPTLAVTSEAVNGIGMGAATTFVLLASNVLISLLKNVIPDKVRIAAFIVVIASFVTIVDLVMKAYTPDLYKTLGIFIPLIVVNCIILGRAEAFAQKNKVLPSMLDGLGMGIGFTLALTAMGAFREILGNGSIFGYKMVSENAQTILLFIMPPGAFFTYGYMIALTNRIKTVKK
ncbi:MAG: electron transport complex subunit E [Bacteroidota bacterium]|nr:MAG: electron transport complex subunit E [Bacteroidota bacterium]